MRVLSKFLKFIIRDKLLLMSWVCDLNLVTLILAECRAPYNSVKRPCSPRVFVAQWMEPGVQQIMFSIPVGVSFFVPRSCQVDQFTFTIVFCSYASASVHSGVYKFTARGNPAMD